MDERLIAQQVMDMCASCIHGKNDCNLYFRDV
jgi:hypothetical protein